MFPSQSETSGKGEGVAKDLKGQFTFAIKIARLLEQKSYWKWEFDQ